MDKAANICLEESDNVADPGSAKSMGEKEGSVGVDEGRINQNKVCEEITAFVNLMCNESPSTLDLPESVEVFLGLVEGLIGKYDCGGGEGSAKLENGDEQDMEFFNAIESLSKLTNALGGHPAHSTEMTAALNRGNCAKKRTMTFLEDQFRALLEQPKKSDSEKGKKIKTQKQSLKHELHESDHCVQQEANESGEGDFPGYSPGAVTSMSKIANAMISSSSKNECSQIYGVARRSAFKEAMSKLGFEGISPDDLQKMPWESLEGEVNTWIRVVKRSATVHFPGERSLCDAVFSTDPHMWNELFSPLTQTVGIKLLDFAGAVAVAVTKRSPEKLFKFIDMYETIRDNIPIITSQFEPSEPAEELKKETSSVLCRIAEVIINIFIELENSIKSDIGKHPVPSGTVHPLTRYTINYLGYACEYYNTLDQIFKQQANHQEDKLSSTSSDTNNHTDNSEAPSSPFVKQIAKMLDLLDTNLIAKSNLYKDASLRNIFLMNNSRYILQKMKGITQVYQSLGESWRRKRSSELRQYHKTWVVSDTQLQSELRISVSSVVVPAYRSFIGRFGQYMTEKYVKYQPDDIQSQIDDLFDGNPNSMRRGR